MLLGTSFNLTPYKLFSQYLNIFFIDTGDCEVKHNIRPFQYFQYYGRGINFIILSGGPIIPIIIHHRHGQIYSSLNKIIQPV